MKKSFYLFFLVSWNVLLADVHALATADKKAAFIMIWNYYYYDDIPGIDAKVDLQVNSIPAKK